MIQTTKIEMTSSRALLQMAAKFRPRYLRNFYEFGKANLQPAAGDPQADLEVNLTCPACGHRWAALVDVAAFLWTELKAQARRLLREVHTLALAYGWRESDILAMSSRRRQAYLDMVGA